MTLVNLRILPAGLLLVASLQAFAAEGGSPAFTIACAPCHGADGRARTPASRKLRVKDLSLSKLTEEQIQKQILNGSKGPDEAHKMPSFEGKLTPEQLKEIVRFVKALQK